MMVLTLTQSICVTSFSHSSVVYLNVRLELCSELRPLNEQNKLSSKPRGVNHPSRARVLPNNAGQ